MSELASRFITAVMPDFPEEGTAYLNVHWSRPNTDYDPSKPEVGLNKKKFWDGRAAKTVEEAARTISWVNTQAGRDIYVCMSLQGRAMPKTSAKGHAYVAALRASSDAVLLRSLYIDIDVKEGAYATTQEALRALQKFIGDTGLPMPTAVVASGSGGFHSHWALEDALPREDWQVLADKLAAAVVDHGLIADTQCTVDAARILRVPGTLNFKTDPPNEVKLMSLGSRVSNAIMHSVLAGYTAKPSTRPSTGSPFENGALAKSVTPAGKVENDLAANMTSNMVIKVEDLYPVCPFVARSVATGGKDNPQPLWFLTAVMATYLDDGRGVLHSMSDRHVGYSKDETNALYDRVDARGKQQDLGWPKCSKIASYGTPECKSCPLLQQQKSPLNFAKPQKKAVQDDSLPPNFIRDPDGLINYRTVDDDGNVLTIPICGYPIMNGWLSNNPWAFHFSTVTESGRKSDMEIPTEVIFAKDGFPKYLGSKGFFCTDKQFKLLKEFFVAWLQKLQTQKDKVISAAPFGWSVVDGKIEGFTYAGRVWMNSDDRPAAVPNPVLSYQYTPKGELEVWNEVAKIVYEQKRPGLDAILAVAFAAPLVRFTGFSGLILNSYSAESGIGKTTAMKVSQAVWGNPTLAMQGLNDTPNSVLGKMGQIRSLPMYWDEIKSDAQVKRFCSIVFDLTGGREKTRMHADASLRMSGTWQTMMVSASNDSIVDGMAREVGSTTAGLHRLFEFAIPKPAEMSRDIGAVQRLIGKLDENYGTAGLIYSRFLGAHWKRVESEVAAMQDELYREVNVKQEERMWIATIAILLKGAEYGNELGLTQIDTVQLRAFLMEVLEGMRALVDQSPSDLNNDMSVSSILAEFINAHRARNTLVTNRIWVGQGKPPKNTIQVQSDASKLSELVIQIGRDDGLMRISSTTLTRWMAERGYSRHTFVQRLEKEFGLRKVNGKLAGGTEMSAATEHLLELDMNHPKLSQFIQ